MSTNLVPLHSLSVGSAFEIPVGSPPVRCYLHQDFPVLKEGELPRPIEVDYLPCHRILRVEETGLVVAHVIPHSDSEHPIRLDSLGLVKCLNPEWASPEFCSEASFLDIVSPLLTKAEEESWISFRHELREKRDLQRRAIIQAMGFWWDGLRFQEQKDLLNSAQERKDWLRNVKLQEVKTPLRKDTKGVEALVMNVIFWPQEFFGNLQLATPRLPELAILVPTTAETFFPSRP